MYWYLKPNIRNSKDDGIIKTQSIFENFGFNPELVISDLNNDGTEDMLISMNSGGNGYGHIYYALYTLKNNELKQMDLESIRDKDTHIKFQLYDEDQLLLQFEDLKDNFIVPLSRYQAVLYKKLKNKEKFYNDADWRVIHAKVEPIYKRKNQSDKAKQITTRAQTG